MPVAADARAELGAFCSRGLDWAIDPVRMPHVSAKARHAAVLILFGVLDSAPALVEGPVARDLDVLLQRRAATLGSHPGQISFPGGRLEASDADPSAGALREAVEETGLDPAGVEILGALQDLPLAVSNHLVTPVLAWWTRPSQVAAVDHAETVDVFRAPVAELLDPANRGSITFTIGDDVWVSPAFTLGDTLVWGFTAIVLSRVFDEVGWTLPWDESRDLTALLEKWRMSDARAK